MTKKILQLLRRLQQRLVDLSIYRVYECDLRRLAPDKEVEEYRGCISELSWSEREALRDSENEILRKEHNYHLDGVDRCYVYREGGSIASMAWIWFGKNYSRGFLDMKEDEAKLIEIVTLPAFRGRGLAAMLIRFASEEMKKKGFRKLYARIWHSNRSSVRTFEKAGWRYDSLVLDLRPPLLRKRLRWVHQNKNQLSMSRSS